MSNFLWLVPLAFLVGLIVELRLNSRGSDDIQEYYADYYEEDGK